MSPIHESTVKILGVELVIEYYYTAEILGRHSTHDLSYEPVPEDFEILSIEHQGVDITYFLSELTDYDLLVEMIIEQIKSED